MGCPGRRGRTVSQLRNAPKRGSGTQKHPRLRRRPGGGQDAALLLTLIVPQTSRGRSHGPWWARPCPRCPAPCLAPPLCLTSTAVGVEEGEVHHHGPGFPAQDVAAAGRAAPLLERSLVHWGEGDAVVLAVVGSGPEGLTRGHRYLSQNVQKPPGPGDPTEPQPGAQTQPSRCWRGRGRCLLTRRKCPHLPAHPGTVFLVFTSLGMTLGTGHTDSQGEEKGDQMTVWISALPQMTWSTPISSPLQATSCCHLTVGMDVT